MQSHYRHEPSHSTLIDSDANSSITKFFIRNSTDPLWAGMAITGPQESQTDELSQSLLEIWLAQQINHPRMPKAHAIKVVLKIDAMWVFHNGQEQHSITDTTGMTMMLWKCESQEAFNARAA